MAGTVVIPNGSSKHLSRAYFSVSNLRNTHITLAGSVSEEMIPTLANLTYIYGSRCLLESRTEMNGFLDTERQSLRVVAAKDESHAEDEEGSGQPENLD